MSVYQEAYHLPEFTYDKYEKLTIEQRGPVYICSFNDPGNLNAMSYEQMAEFNDFLNLVRYDKTSSLKYYSFELHFKHTL